MSADIRVVDTAVIGQALKDAVAGADVLIVLGGDGAVGSAASLCGETGPVLIPLPGGTMEMLPELFTTLPTGNRIARDAGRSRAAAPAAGRRFSCAAILGAPRYGPTRQAVRGGR